MGASGAGAMVCGGGAAACGADGLMIEVHNDPKHAKCDGAQSLTPAQFDDVAKGVKAVRAAIGGSIDG